MEMFKRMEEIEYPCPKLEGIESEEFNRVTQDYCRSFNFGKGCFRIRTCLAYKEMK